MSSAGRAPSGFAGQQFGGGFDGELSPEELFNMFFGGGMNGFGGGPGMFISTSSTMRFLKPVFGIFPL